MGNFCVQCGNDLPGSWVGGSACSARCFMKRTWWRASCSLRRWWKAPVACKIGKHQTSKTNISYDLETLLVDFHCIHCDKLVITKRLDDAGNVPEVMELKRQCLGL